MDDEEWVIEDPSESQPEPAPEEAAPAEAAPVEEPPPPEPEPEPKQEEKKFLCKHWVRPKFLQYNYMYDYRYNYYNDVINYLDRRNKGLPTETPRAQTWGERALRTYISKTIHPLNATPDKALLHHISSGARFHRYHSKSLIARKYSHLGYNTITI